MCRQRRPARPDRCRVQLLTRRCSRFAAVALALALGGCSGNSGGPGVSPDTVAFLDTLQHKTFNFFWDLTPATNGLTPDRWPTPSFSSIAAVGFALTAYPIGVEHGWINRAEAADRTLATLRFFWTAPQDSAGPNTTGYRGFFYHFLDMSTGKRFRTVELSTIDTSLLLAGILFAQSYFTGSDTTEQEIRALADSIYFRVDWKWAEARPPAVSMGWHPESGFINTDWIGYNEAMILNILALASPTHPADSAAWSAWVSGYQWGTYYGRTFVQFAPLFGHEYSHVWIDFRNIKDAYMQGRGIDYFENSRRAALSQRGYGIANPGGWRGYTSNVWGLTACDGPANKTLTIGGRSRQFHTYFARGAALGDERDDGTICPRPRSRSPRCSRCARPTATTCSRPTAFSTRSTPPSPHRANRKPVPSIRRSAGSTSITSASTRDRSWRWSRATAAISCGA